MKDVISGNLRRLRLAKGVTQEQLAEVLDVSAQAVSRWETGASLPELPTLAALAIYYGVSVDTLLGMDELRREEALNRVHGEINRLVQAGNHAQAAALIRRSLHTWPGDSGLLLSLGETLAHLPDDASLQEAIRIDERVLAEGGISMKAQATVRANLLFLYLRAGQQERAAALVQSLSHIWECREMLLPELAQGDAYAAALREAAMKALVFLCRRIDDLPERRRGVTPDWVQLGVDFTPPRPPEQLLETLSAFLLAAR